jgi:dephospho-CoA kinase
VRILGLTGGIGSGKSMVALMFAQLGADVIDADQLARDVVEPGQPALLEIAATFGRDLLLPDGRLNRGKLAGIIFADAAARAKLNAITHPRIRERMEAEVVARDSGPGVLILDIPLLYESARADSVEKVIVVWVDPETQLRRLIERDGLSMDEAHRRVATQMPLNAKRSRADHVIDNSGSRENTRRQVEAVYRLYAPATPGNPRAAR